MNNIMIVTICDFDNIGNRLQNYALEHLLVCDMGCNVSNLIYFWKDYRQKNIKLLFKAGLEKIGIKRFKGSCFIRNRRKLLYEWSKNNIHNWVVIGSRYDDLNKIDFTRYDYFVSGSDQVWHNWKRQERELDYYYLRFVPEEKRISFSASFGFDSVPEIDLNQHQCGLKDMKALSCREESGVDLIYKLTGRKAKLIPDPTLCVSRNKWDSLLKRPLKIPKGKYVLSFFLGKISNRNRESIDHFCKTNQYTMLEISKEKKTSFYAIDPGHFLWIVKNASWVFTDSFHATVFSIIFKRNFYSLTRDNSVSMFNRIITLLEAFDLQDRSIYSDLNQILSISPERFEKVDDIIEKNKKEAILYLNKAFLVSL